MVLFSSVKLILISLVALYTSYLYIYKCENVSTLEAILHPINNHHKSLCDYVYKTEEFAKPHLSNAQSFLDKNVHSTEFFQKYQIHEHFVSYSTKAYEFVHPFLIEIYKLVEIVEVYVYDYSVLAWTKAVYFYNTTVVPKIKELTSK
ncbi:hypothetical protein PSN45_001257 [Yamadazyma tenuis]|uniref:Uncharacterized protein n=1 Tax=Candida tenuis (strain ATCC 10573 / BCRC 21748 / CBS 615 / JCM 9827 / NBRC 10315 / NRRL Y-1498 / VKM Y-70) TaxID=590646 RepID=G3BDE7_CANTC|nr:uncharacterized protein CANTEDRAFT_110518 [Yamadazyma tenuis ATCC 10573]EGV60940.1 hypothetical protein CANTEDRAFT_110518 [Yamadazyma tenuis ATCC 10573]WEJ93782.1 hypothetical protein PSN45_001257 [Yamadazyma tenuis]